jgi:hypothetical protein
MRFSLSPYPIHPIRASRLKVEVVCSIETFVSMQKSTRSYNPEEHRQADRCRCLALSHSKTEIAAKKTSKISGKDPNVQLSDKVSNK